MVRAPFGVLPAGAFIAYVMQPHVGALLAWGWVAVVLAIWGGRAVISALLLRSPPVTQHVAPWIRFQTGAALVGGLAGGVAGILFYRAPELEYAYLTMVVCGWCAAGLAVSGALPVAFYGFVILFLAPLSAAWAFSGHTDGLLIATLLVLFIFLLTTYARDNAQLVARALRVGFENESLRERAEAANLSKSAFLAAASHDLRQPLHALSLLLSTLQERTREPEAAALLAKITTSADSLDKLFKGLLDLSRLDAGSINPERRPVALGSLLARLENDYRPLAAAKGLGFRCAATQAWVVSDAEMLERLLRNLLDNAVKYTDRGGIEVAIEEGAQRICLRVRDTGIGIDPQHGERIFEAYYQIRNPERDRRRGIGLGLAIVKRLCDLLGHSIRLESQPGRGSTFELVLARAEAPASEVEDARRADVQSIERLRGMVVVVIEDDAEVQDAARALLEGWSCRGVVCPGSAQALQELEQRALAPDAIMADYRLASAENGLDAIRRLYERHGSVPAAIVTGEINAADLQVPDDMPVVVMQKPLRAADIRDWLLFWKSAD